MCTTVTRDNLKRLAPGVRPVVQDDKRVGVIEVDQPSAYIVSDVEQNSVPGLCLYVGK